MWVLEIKLDIKPEIVCRVSFLRTTYFFDMRLFFILDPTTVLVKILFLVGVWRW